MKFLKIKEKLININNISDIFILENEESKKFGVIVQYKKYDYFANKEKIYIEIYYEANSKKEALGKLNELENILNS